MSKPAFEALFEAFVEKLDEIAPEEPGIDGPSPSTSVRRQALEETRLFLGSVLAKADFSLAGAPRPVPIPGSPTSLRSVASDSKDSEETGSAEDPLALVESLDPVEKLIGEKMYERADPHGLFLRFDRSQRGYLTASEFRQVLAALGISLSDAELAFLIHKYGAGGSVFDWAAFCRVYDDWHSRMETTYGTLFNATLTRRPLADPAMTTGSPGAGRDKRSTADARSRLLQLLDAVRAKLYTTWGTASKAYLELTGHASGGAEMVTSDQILDGLMKRGMEGITLEDVNKLIWPYTQTHTCALTLSEFSRFMVGADPAPPEGRVASYLDDHRGRRRSVQRSMSEPAAIAERAAVSQTSASWRESVSKTPDLEGFDGPVADEVPDGTFALMNSAVYATHRPLKATFDRMCSGTSREGLSVNDFQRGMHDLGVDVPLPEVRRLFMMFVHHGKKHRMNFPEFVRCLAHADT